MLLSKAQKYLEIVRKRGWAQAELRRVYYNIATNKELFLRAYANLYANDGAMTPGTDPEDTIDGMSVKRIESLMEKLKTRTYRWKPVRRMYVDKKNSKKKRPLSMPGFNDKMVEEVLRMVLEAYYEPQFRKCSNGFRPERGCHTALDTIARWKGIRWFIEGDIKGCFDNLSHKVILKILRKRIKDRALLKLIEKMLKAGYVENWKYYETYSGAPQGGILSPLIANIVLNELDKFIEDELIPVFMKGKQRKFNMEYINLSSREQRARKRGDWTTAKILRKQYTKLPSRLPNDPGFRRLLYVRYADDFLLGLIGTTQDALTIKKKIKEFLKSIGLEMSTEKTLITHARTGKARFLNYHINLMDSKNKVSVVKKHAIAGTHKRRTINQQLYFSIPNDVTRKWLKRVQKGGKSQCRKELLNLSDYDIITTYEVELQGLINYYSRIYNLQQLRHLRYKWTESLIKTLAAKHRTKKKAIRRKYQQFMNVKGQKKLIGIEIQRGNKKPLKAVFGKKPIQGHKDMVIKDKIQTIHVKRNELIKRLLAEICELCGLTNVALEGHHIRKLKDLKKKWKGKEKPKWVEKMIAITRKTLFVCTSCHQSIHVGKYDGRKLTQVLLESPVL